VCGREQGEIVLNPLYRFAEHGEENGKICGRLEKVGSMRNRSKLSIAGIVSEETKEAEDDI
jgi:pilus assembly protein CpaF